MSELAVDLSQEVGSVYGDIKVSHKSAGLYRQSIVSQDEYLLWLDACSKVF
jgi:hypothetical protein